jgi:hypothetical protein
MTKLPIDLRENPIDYTAGFESLHKVDTENSRAIKLWIRKLSIYAPPILY